MVDGDQLHGFDLATGEELWTVESPPADVAVVDGALIATGYDDVSRYDLP